MNLFRFALIAGFAAGCTAGSPSKDDDTGLDTGDDTDVTDTDDTDSTDTDVTDVAPTFNEDAFTTDWTDFIDCGTANEVSFEIELNNWGYDVQMYMAQTKFYGGFDAHDEEHTLAENTALRSTDNDGDGFSVFERTLTTGASLANQAPDTSTLWKCSPDTPSLDPSDSANFQVGWALAVWGEGADTTMDAPTDCIVFGTDVDELLTDAAGDGRVPPSWLTSDNCRSIVE